MDDRFDKLTIKIMDETGAIGRERYEAIKVLLREHFPEPAPADNGEEPTDADISHAILNDDMRGVDHAQLRRLFAARPQPSAQLLRDADQPQDFPEDAAGENGNYWNECIECGRMFIGHKRRIVCKLCARPAPTDEKALREAAGAFLKDMETLVSSPELLREALRLAELGQPLTLTDQLSTRLRALLAHESPKDESAEAGLREVLLAFSAHLHDLDTLPNGHDIGMMEVGYDMQGQVYYGPFWMSNQETDKIVNDFLEARAALKSEDKS